MKISPAFVLGLAMLVGQAAATGSNKKCVKYYERVFGDGEIGGYIYGVSFIQPDCRQTAFDNPLYDNFHDAKYLTDNVIGRSQGAITCVLPPVERRRKLTSADLEGSSFQMKRFFQQVNDERNLEEEEEEEEEDENFRCSGNKPNFPLQHCLGTMDLQIFNSNSFLTFRTTIAAGEPNGPIGVVETILGGSGKFKGAIGTVEVSDEGDGVFKYKVCGKKIRV